MNDIVYTRRQTYSQLLTKYFYEWESRGRGWAHWPHPVDVVPPFVGFSRPQFSTQPVADDARLPSLFGSFFRSKTELLPTKPPVLIDPVVSAPPQLIGVTDLCELNVALPQSLKVNQQTSEQLILSLGACSGPITFELIGSTSEISFQFAVGAGDKAQVEQQLQSHLPEAVLTERHDFLSSHWHEFANFHSVILDYGLANEFMRPLQSFTTFEPDPLTSFLGVMSTLGEGEVGILQVLFRSVRDPWADSILRSLTDHEGKPFFGASPEFLPLARQKIARPLLAAVIRVAARAVSTLRSEEIASALGASLNQFTQPSSNHLVRMPTAGSVRLLEQDLLERTTHRSGMVINSEELASLVHLPSASVRIDKLQRVTKKTRLAPALSLGHQVVLGHNSHRGKTTQVTLSPGQRMHHCFIAGATGSGKSTLLKSMAVQDIVNGEGCCVIDPHSDLINDLLAQVPERRFNDVIIFDPADQSPVPFNVLSAHSELEKNLLASDLVSIFRRQCTSWGDQLNAVLTNAVLCFLESTQGGTLADLRRFLVETEYRKTFLRTVLDEELVYFWLKEFPLLRGHPQAPILTRLNAFLRPKPIRQMVAQQASSLDMRSIIDGSKILFVKLSQGLIGIENAQLLGSLILSKLHQAALSRQDIDESERTKVSIYVDECQYFLAPSVTALLSGGRKHGVGLVLATQEYSALWNADKDIASSVLTNPYTRIAFRLGDLDAKKLAEGFAHFDSEDLQNLGVGEAIVRMQTNDNDFNLKTLAPIAVDSGEAKIRREQITLLSRERYGRKSIEGTPPTAIMSTVTAPPNPLSNNIDTQPTLARPAVPTISKSEKPAIADPNPLLLGRGGHEHKYLQHFIKRLADDLGFCTTIEQPVLRGIGSIDVALTKGTRKIACEISVTSTPDYELKNIEKCLAADFDPVIVIGHNKRNLSKIKKRADDELSAESLSRVIFIQADELPALLDHYAQEDPGTESTVKGYKVKVKRRAVSGQDAEIRKAAISKVLLKSLHKLKQDDG